MASSSLARTLVPAVLRATLRSRPIPDEVADQSVDTFLSAYFGAEFARTFGSALVHGIYAADSRQLSVRAAFPSLWDASIRGKGNIVRGIVQNALRPSNNLDDKTYEMGNMMDKMKGVSVYSFQDGMETITRALRQDLEKRHNVEIIAGDAAASLRRDASDTTFKIDTVTGRRIDASHVVSAISLKALNNIVPPSIPITSTTSQNSTSSVTVVNIVFPPTSFPIHPPGFGYLVPRPRSNALDAELEDHAGTLGVVFDSCALPQQDLYANAASPRFTKVTMMLGGPHAFPHNAESVSEDKLLGILSRHLAPSQPLPKPVLIRVHHLTGCIPTPTVGHLQRIAAVKNDLKKSEFWRGNLEIVGAGVGGVSVPDCIEQGRHVGLNW
ncbi:oxygen-dependent protoporphyrinogen oxidase [Steccherinum ochraceum]|uniref:Protoporphyrinogen oxidase n=1 Tax=Steccherinum ochraceum TaxID=92696 RepID=A0A4R0RFE3_9APHY|nr:oxygen-dependent protoporphyrinogen oxidase [Steccherinum ochraceum]